MTARCCAWRVATRHARRWCWRRCCRSDGVSTTATPGAAAARSAFRAADAGRGGDAAGSAQGGAFADDRESTTHFGFREVPVSEKTRLVRDVFASVAPTYDLMNDLMSGGLHRLWKDHFVRRRLAPLPGMRCLDVAGGTGDIAARIARCAPGASVTVCDINEEMLRVGEERLRRRRRGPRQHRPRAGDGDGDGGEDDEQASIRFVQGDAEQLPFDDEQFDAYTISFGMRNVTRPERALAEARRVLRRGGRFLMLEFGRVEHERLRQLYDAYAFRVIPEMGQAVANDRQSYEYLVQSIRRFADQQQFCRMMRRAGGFRHVTYENMTFGVAAIYSGYKL